MASSAEVSSDELQVRQILTKYVSSGNSQNVDALKKLLKNISDSKKADILQDYENPHTPNSYTIFHLAASRDDCEIIRVLLSSFKSKSRLPLLKKYKTTPLHTAAKFGCRNCLDAILSHVYLKEDHKNSEPNLCRNPTYRAYSVDQRTRFSRTNCVSQSSIRACC